MRTAILLSLFLSATCAISAKIIEDTFSRIKNTPGEQMVVFYRTSDPESAAILNTVEKVAKEIQKYKNSEPSLSHFAFKKCDGDLAVNRADFEEAQFASGTTFLFTSTPIEGIEKYSGPRTVEAIVEHIKHKYLPYDETDVLKLPPKADEDWFWSRLDAQPEGYTRPVFVKFYEEWCEHCKRMRLNFMRAAGYFKNGIPGSPRLPGVDFMEVHCSRDEDTTAFCVHNNVRSYPVLMLFTGEKKIQFQENEKTISNYGSFFKTHLTPSSPSPSPSSAASPSPKSIDKDDDDDEDVATTTKPIKKTEKPLPSRRVDPDDAHASQQRQQDTEESVEASTQPRVPMGRFTPPKEPEISEPVASLPAESLDSTGSATTVDKRLSALESSVDEIKQLLRAVLAK